MSGVDRIEDPFEIEGNVSATPSVMQPGVPFRSHNLGSTLDLTQFLVVFGSRKWARGQYMGHALFGKRVPE